MANVKTRTEMSLKGVTMSLKLNLTLSKIAEISAACIIPFIMGLVIYRPPKVPGE